MNNISDHVRSDKVKWIVTTVALLLIFTILGGLIAIVVTDKKPSEWFKKTNQTQQSDTSLNTFDYDNLVDVDLGSTAHLMLTKSEIVASTASEVKALEFTITATVLPEDATNKAVNWTLSGDKDSDSPVSEDLATIEVVGGDGANKVVFRLYSSDKKSYYVKAITRDGGYTAMAQIVYSQSARAYEVEFLRVAVVNGVGNTTDYSATKVDDKYDIPGYVKPNGTYSMKLNFIGFFGEASSTKKANDCIECTLKLSDGTAVAPEHFTFECMTDYAGYAMVLFSFDDTFWQLYRAKLKTTTLNIAVKNTRLNLDLGTIKIRLTVPVTSVSTSETQIFC